MDAADPQLWDEHGEDAALELENVEDLDLYEDTGLELDEEFDGGDEIDCTPDDTEHAPFERENSYDYRPGGFHPVDLGSFIDTEKRFKAVYKLGHGGYATVWLCRDTAENTWKAVKIMTAHASDNDFVELKIRSILADVDDKTLNGKHIALPLEHFWVQGPNGSHLCLVLPVLGGTIADEWCESGNDPTWRKRICYQLVEAVAFLHSKGICHGDIRPANILMRIKGLEKLSETDLLALLGEPRMQEFPENPDMELGQHVPKFLYADSFLDLGPEYVSSDIALVDFGVAFEVSNPPEMSSIPQPYLPPEDVFGTATPGINNELWNVGCAIYEFNKNSCPFFAEWGVRHWVKDWEDALGPLPEPYRSKWVEMDYKIAGQDHPLVDGNHLPMVSMTPKYLCERREGWLEELGTSDMLEGKLGLPIEFYHRIFRRPGSETEKQGIEKSAFEETSPPPGYEERVNKISQEELQELKALLLKLWRYDPRQRISAADVLNSSWFDGRRRKEQALMSSKSVRKGVRRASHKCWIM